MARKKAASRSRRKAVKVTPLPLELDKDKDKNKDGKVRLNKFLASAGICSRRAADELITRGRVSVGGTTAIELGMRVDPDVDEVLLDGVPVRKEKPVYVLFNKPKGVVCTNARNEQRKRVIDCLEGVKGRIYTVGRLDADSEGLILLTNDGDFAQSVTHPRFGVPKTYAVLAKGTVDANKIRKARQGVWLSEGKTDAFRIRIERRSRDRTYMKVTLREGKNREIRRVFARLGHRVISVKRVRIGNLSLHGLGVGRYRFLKAKEIEDLRSLASGPEEA